MLLPASLEDLYNEQVMAAFWTAFFLIFLAEMGDKTQFMTLALSTKYKALTVMLGVTIGTFIVSLVSVALGETMGKLLPFFWINIFAGFAFIIFGIITWLDKETETEAGETSNVPLKQNKMAPVVAIAVTFFFAELGDKTMLATVAIASKESQFFQVWFGSTLGLVGANALAIFAGKFLKKYLTGAVLKYLIVGIYLISGVAAISQNFFGGAKLH